MANPIPLTDTLAAFAFKHGVAVDLTPLAQREAAYNDMWRAAMNRDDAAWDEAKARYEQVAA